MEQLHAIIHGVVQGVGFRASVSRQARALLIEGYVRNLPDGNVEVVAEAKRESLETFLEFLRQGPADASVSHVDVEWREAAAESFDGFAIRYV